MDGNEFEGYKEKAEHGDALMPLKHYRCQVPYSYRDLSLHWHEEAEVSLILEGEIQYDINFESYHVKAGDMLLISPHTLHSAHEVNGSAMTSDSLVFSLDMLGCRVPDACTMKYIRPIQTGKYRFVPVVGHDAPGQLPGCFQQLVACLGERREGYELEVKEQLFGLLRLAYQYGYVVKNQASAVDGEVEDKLKGVLAYIQEHYREPISIGELAGVCHFSQVHFMNFFKRLAGMTCVEYMNQYRLNKVAAQLAETKVAVMDAAMEHGFRNVSYFNKLFKEKFGVTPKEYRREVKGEASG